MASKELMNKLHMVKHPQVESFLPMDVIIFIAKISMPIIMIIQELLYKTLHTSQLIAHLHQIILEAVLALKMQIIVVTIA